MEQVWKREGPSSAPHCTESLEHSDRQWMGSAPALCSALTSEDIYQQTVCHYGGKQMHVLF